MVIKAVIKRFANTVMCRRNLMVQLTIVNLLFLFNLCASETTNLEVNTLHRSRRQLLYPNSTLLQLTVGFGTPTLTHMINMNWGFQANFQLPWNRTQIPVDVFNAYSGYTGESRMARDTIAKEAKYKNDASFYHFYKYVEDTLDSFGHNGSSCVLQTLCQIGAEPLHSDDEEDLLHEIATFVLNPTNDNVEGITETDERYRYVDAYHNGQEGTDCVKKFDNCTMSLLDIFTKINETDG